jgi:hypothetical protein
MIPVKEGVAEEVEEVVVVVVVVENHPHSHTHQLHHPVNSGDELRARTSTSSPLHRHTHRLHCCALNHFTSNNIATQCNKGTGRRGTRSGWSETTRRIPLNASLGLTTLPESALPRQLQTLPKKKEEKPTAMVMLITAQLVVPRQRKSHHAARNRQDEGKKANRNRGQSQSRRRGRRRRPPPTRR